MGKDKNKQKTNVEAAKPWYRSQYLAPFALLAAFAVGAFTWALKERAKNTIAAEHARYGNLWEYKDQLPISMIEKKGDKYLFEEFLPKLKMVEGKFDVNVYIGNPPADTALKLTAVPADLIPYIKDGLNKWNQYFNFKYVDKIENADVKIFGEGAVLKLLEQNGRALTPDLWGHELWQRFSRDKGVMGYTILLNSNYIDNGRKNPEFFRFVTGHEFGHFLGLRHPDTVLYFDIKKVRGISNPLGQDGKLIGQILAEQAVMYPNFPNFTIMSADGSLQVGKRDLGEFDKKAMDIVLKLFHEKYGEHYQPSAKPSAKADGPEITKWRQIAMSSTDSRVR